MIRGTGAGFVAGIVLAAPAYAGEEVLYGEAPAWVQTATIDMESALEGPSQVLFDWQHRLEGGVVHQFHDSAVRIDNAEALTSEGTLQMTWSPDKGDLTIHRLEILRDEETVDLVAQGVEFEVLRREQGLEQRLLDGRLTATLAVPGLKEGDILRVAYSVTVDDQALGNEMQALQYLPPEPYRVGLGRVIMSWPDAEPVLWSAGPDVTQPEPVSAGGYTSVTIDFPITKREDMPGDAPSRFSRAPLLRAGTFDSWQDLSRVMEPHFTKAARLDPEGQVVAEAEYIMKQSTDPLKRAELAVRLVQDDVSYLLNGLDGGNYLPQAAEETWEKRYGDCKAKSVLLLSLLRHMGIDADVVLVTTQGGDALPELQPLPANFDHMIVRATIGGVDYWLDGTSSATRLNNMAKNPPFYHALPLTAGGSDLQPIVGRASPTPDMAVYFTYDHSAGIDLPPLYEMRMEISGPGGARIGTIVDEDDPEIRKQMVRQFSGGPGGARATSVDFAYDEESALGSVHVKGVGEPGFDFEQGRMEMALAGASDSVTFAPNRARPKWRDIPVATGGSTRNLMQLTVILPEDGKGFMLEGTAELDDSFANTQLSRSTRLNGKELVVVEEQVAKRGEVAVEDLAEARRAALRISKADLTLKAPAGIKRLWELSESEIRKRTALAVDGYTQAIEQADDDDFGPLLARAAFYSSIYDFEAAQKDYSAVIAEEPSEGLFLDRAYVYESMGRLEDAIADTQSAYELSPDNDTAYYQARLMAWAGRPQDALDLLDLLPVSDDEMDGMVDARAQVLALNGDVDTALAILDERLQQRNDSASLLNSDCWLRGLHKVALDDAIAQCTRAVERATNASSVLDSRAMVHFRKGDYVAALADADAALQLNPAQSATRYLRGLIMLEQGDRNGRDLIDMALRQTPYLREYYALFGIEPRL